MSYPNPSMQVPMSAEVRREVSERQQLVAELYPLWEADPLCAGRDFHDPAELCRWVVRRLLAVAGKGEGEAADDELRTIADGVSRIVGRGLAAQFGLE